MASLPNCSFLVLGIGNGAFFDFVAPHRGVMPHHKPEMVGRGLFRKAAQKSNIIELKEPFKRIASANIDRGICLNPVFFVPST